MTFPIRGTSFVASIIAGSGILGASVACRPASSHDREYLDNQNAPYVFQLVSAQFKNNYPLQRDDYTFKCDGQGSVTIPEIHAGSPVCYPAGTLPEMLANFSFSPTPGPATSMPFRLKVDAEEQSSAMGFVFTQNLNLQNLPSGIGLDFTEDNGNSINLPVAKTQFTANWSVSFDNANTDYLIAWTTNPLYVTYGLPIPPLSSNNSNVATVTRMDYVCNAASNLSDPSSIIQQIGGVATGQKVHGGVGFDSNYSMFGGLSSAWAAMGKASDPLGGTGADCITLSTLMQYQLDMLGVRGASPHTVYPRHASWNGIDGGPAEMNGLLPLIYWSGSPTNPSGPNNFEGCCAINGRWWMGGFGTWQSTPVQVLVDYVTQPNTTADGSHQCWSNAISGVVPYPTSDAPLSVVTVTCSPESVRGGASATGTVTLSANAPEGGVVVSLHSSDIFASVPGQVFVNSNSNSASFTINTSAALARDTIIIKATGTDPTTGYISWSEGRLTVTP